MSIMRQNVMHLPRIVVIGGGATGTGIALAAAERGMEVVLVERGGLGSGTSSRFHGVLHSGSRYAVADPTVAAECYQENQTLRRLIPSVITDTGGLFVALNDQEAAHGDVLKQACLASGIPIREIAATKVHQLEPKLTRAITRAFSVPDGFIDGAALIRLNSEQARQVRVPVRFMTNVRVTGFKRTGDHLNTVTVRNGSGATEEIAADYVINAAGVWSGQVAELAGVKLHMLYDKGTMIIFNGQLTRRIINRCRPESDGDLLVPAGNQSIMGTTSRVVTDPEDYYPTQEEADVLVREGTALVPALASAEAYRIYSGIRPLQGDPAADTRSISRSFQVLDHTDQGLNNLISVVGGKVTLYRRMAEATVDLLSNKIG